MRYTPLTRIVVIFAAFMFAMVAGSQTVEPNPVKLFPNADVKAAFEKGGPIFDGNGVNYKVSAGRRDKPGTSELHKKDTDIFYIMEGTATFITGGKMVEGKETAPDEIRGASVEGGQARQLVKGDVIIVPAGVPHWFKSVETAPFLYFVVKVK